MTSSQKSPGFRVVGVRTMTPGVLQRPFFTALWALLEVAPVDSITWMDDDVVGIGTGVRLIHVDIDMLTPASGRIDLWVDNLEAARQLLASKHIAPVPGLPSVGVRTEGFNIPTSALGHEVTVRLSQIYPELLAQYSLDQSSSDCVM